MPIGLTFRTRLQLEQHFDDHKDEVGARDEAHYEQLASDFLSEERPSNTLECIRKRDRARIRYNCVTQEFGIVTEDGIVQTYFKPDPRFHGKSTNRAYFEWECSK